jgi:hypothetical protein
MLIQIRIRILLQVTDKIENQELFLHQVYIILSFKCREGIKICSILDSI